MTLHHGSRRRLCAWTMGAFLLMQCLVVAHACEPLARLLAASGPAALAGAHAGDCHGSASAHDAALCQAHCSADQQVPAKAAPLEQPPQAVGGFMLAFPPAAVMPVAVGVPGSPGTAKRAGPAPGWPPLYLTLGVLRN